MKTVSDLEYIRGELIDIFPDAVRGSVAKSRWGNGRKTLHLAYFIGADTVSGYMIIARGQLFYFVDWDTNSEMSYEFAESDNELMISRIRTLFEGKILKIDRCVQMVAKN